MAPMQIPSDLLIAADVQTHICAKFSRITANFRLLKTNLVKQEQFQCCWRNPTKFFASLSWFIAYLAHFFAQFFLSKKIMTAQFVFKIPWH